MEVSVWLPNKKFSLIYKGTRYLESVIQFNTNFLISNRDGFNHSAFHQLCDNKGPTLTLIQSSAGHLFGGFTAASWEGLKTYKSDPSTFIFTLSNPHNIAPTLYPLKFEETHHAIYCHSSHCPVFGYVSTFSHSDNIRNSY